MGKKSIINVIFILSLLFFLAASVVYSYAFLDFNKCLDIDMLFRGNSTLYANLEQKLTSCIYLSGLILAISGVLIRQIHASSLTTKKTLLKGHMRMKKSTVESG